MRIIVVIILLFTYVNLFSENNKIDSLTKVIYSSTDTVKGNAIYNLAFNYFNNQQYYLAIKNFSNSVEFLYSNEEKIAEIKSYIGLCYYFQGNYSLSLEYYFKGLEIREKLGKKALIGISYNNIGGTYFKLNKYNEALEYYNKSLKIAQNFNDTLNQVHVENNIALILNNQGKYKEALTHYLNLRKLSSKTDYDLSTFYNNIATVYSNMKDYDQATKYFIKAKELSSKLDNKYLLANTYLNLGNLFFTKKNLNKSLENYYKSIEISKPLGANNILKGTYNGLSRIYILKLNSDSAYKYNELFLSINDSLLNKYSINKIAELEAKYNFEKQEQKIEKLKIESENARIKNKIIIIILFSVITIALGFFIIIYLKKKRNISDKFIVKQNVDIMNFQEKLESVITEKNENEISKYEASALSDEMKVILELAISKLMKKEKLYLNNDFTLDELAEKLNTSRSYISQVINTKFGLNFNSFINELRIKEAMSLMSKPENNIYTINAISKKVGFNSISSFNTAFKKVSGVTPSFFNKSVKQ